MSRRLAAAAAALSLALGAWGADPGPDPSTSAQWRPLLEALAARPAVVAPFTERRFFRFRREPVVLRGVLRVSKERGLSLQYTEPEPSVVIADATGILLRGADGRERSLDAGSREAGSLAPLLPILRFDLSALSPSFEIRGRRAGDAWSIDFVPRDPSLAASLGEIKVGGDGPEVRRLELRRSASQRVEIEVGPALAGSTIGPADLRRFFR
jgi:hypothetical protein